MTTPVPPLTDIPSFPALADRAAGTYNGKAYAFCTHMADTFNAEILALADNVLDNATDAEASATLAGDKADEAADSVTAAGLLVVDAEAAKDGAEDARDLAQTYAAAAGAAAGLPSLAGHGGKIFQVKLDETGIEYVPKPTFPGPRNYTVAQYTASATFTVPADCTVIRPYAFGAGAAGNGSTLGGAGGGCAYGDIAVTPGQSVTLSIVAGVAKVTVAGVDLLTANPGTAGSGGAGGTAAKHVSVTNGGAYAGGAGASVSGARGGSSSGSPLGVGVTNTYATLGGAGWGGQGALNAAAGGGVGGSATSAMGGPGLALDSTDPLLRGLTGLPGYSGTLTNQHGANGGPGAGAGSGNGTGLSGLSGFGAGGAANGGVAGFGGGSGAGGTSRPGFGGGGQGATAGEAVIRIYY